MIKKYFVQFSAIADGDQLSKPTGAEMLFSNRPFAAKPSRDLLFIKLWAATLRMPEMEKSMSKTSKRPGLKPLALKNEIL